MRDAGLEHLYSGWHAVAESCRVCKLESVRTTQFLGKELEGQLEWHVVNVCDAFPSQAAKLSWRACRLSAEHIRHVLRPQSESESFDGRPPDAD